MFELPQIISLLILSLFLLVFIKKIFSSETTKPKATTLAKPYPIIGHLLAFYQQKREHRFEWLASLVVSSPTSTFVVHRPFGGRNVFTGNPANVEHILKTHFPNYIKGPHHKIVFGDVFGDSLLTQNGEEWKFQRQVASHVFSPKSLRNYVENVVDFELSKRLIPILSQAAKNNEVIDLQHILQRFAFDNICMVAFGYDPAYLLPSLPQAKLSEAFDGAIFITFIRFLANFPIIWKTCRFLNIGLEKSLRDAVCEIREFATSLVKQKKLHGISSTTDENNLLSRLLKYDNLDEKLIIDIVITFIFAGRDPTSAGMTWLFWLIYKNKHVEQEIVKEINNINKKQDTSVFDQLKEMTYMHAALCETMRLYPPVPMDTKQADKDDTMPDGTEVKKGMLVSYVPYAMGRMEELWGADWAEFRPERWLKEEEDDAGSIKWRFVSRDSCSYPVFHAGPRTCLGKDMAFLQMKRIVSGVLSRFKVIPALEGDKQPVYVASMTAKMLGGFPVRVEERFSVK